MFNATEITIIHLLRDIRNQQGITNSILEHCADVIKNLTLLQQKGIICMPKSIEKDDMLKDVSLTEFGFNYPM